MFSHHLCQNTLSYTVVGLAMSEHIDMANLILSGLYTMYYKHTVKVIYIWMKDVYVGTSLKCIYINQPFSALKYSQENIYLEIFALGVGILNSIWIMKALGGAYSHQNIYGNGLKFQWKFPWKMAFLNFHKLTTHGITLRFFLRCFPRTQYCAVRTL